MDNKENQELALALSLGSCDLSTTTLQTTEFAQKYDSLVSLIKQFDEIKKTVDEAIKDAAKDHYFATGENSIKSDGYSFTYVTATTRETFDSKKFKAENPELYVKYTRVSQVADSMRAIKSAPKKESTTEEILDV